MNPTTCIKLAMFDLDGTLFDTFRANYLAYREACGAEFPFDEAFFAAHCMSRSYTDFLPDCGVPADRIEEIHEKKKACYAHYTAEIRPNRSLFALAELMRQSGTVLAIVTTANRRNVHELLDAFGYTDLFTLFVTQEDVTAHKPAPDCYLRAMELAGVQPADCVVFEDSEIGVEAGISAGADVYRIERF